MSIWFENLWVFRDVGFVGGFHIIAILLCFSDVAFSSWFCDVRRTDCRLGSNRCLQLLEIPLVGVVVGDEFFRFGR